MSRLTARIGPRIPLENWFEGKVTRARAVARSLWPPARGLADSHRRVHSLRISSVYSLTDPRAAPMPSKLFLRFRDAGRAEPVRLPATHVVHSRAIGTTIRPLDSSPFAKVIERPYKHVDYLREKQIEALLEGTNKGVHPVRTRCTPLLVLLMSSAEPVPNTGRYSAPGDEEEP